MCYLCLYCFMLVIFNCIPEYIDNFSVFLLSAAEALGCQIELIWCVADWVIISNAFLR